MSSSSERRTPTSATATVRSATCLALVFVQVIRRPAAPTVLCRARAPTGLELGSTQSVSLNRSPCRSSLSAYPAIRSMRRFFRQQRLLSSLAALLWHCSLSWAGAGVGGWAPKIFAQAFCGERRSRRMPDRGHASHVATGSARFAGFRPPAGTAFSLLFCGLPFLRPQSGARQLVRLLLFGRPHFFSPSGHPTTSCSD